MIVGDQSEIDEWAALLHAVGITHFETTWRGMKVLHDGTRSDERTVAVLEMFTERLTELPSFKGREQYIDLVEKALKTHIEKRAENRKKLLDAPVTLRAKPKTVVTVERQPSPTPVPEPKPNMALVRLELQWWRKLFGRSD